MERLSPAASHETEDELTEKRCKVYLIIHHPKHDKVLLHAKSQGRPLASPQMPCFLAEPGPATHFFYETDEWIPALQHQLGILFDVTLLRSIWYNEGHSSHCSPCSDHAILELESHGHPLTLPDGTKWKDTCCIDPSQVLAESARTSVELFLEECRTGVDPPFRSCFERRGWYDSTVSWMKTQLLTIGAEMIDKVTQEKFAYRGTVLKSKTTRGTFFLKCTPPFVNEALITKQLANLAPSIVCKPIATDIDKHLLLMKDYGEILSFPKLDRAELRQWESCVATLQHSTVGMEQALLDAGLRCLTLDVLDKEFGRLLSYIEEVSFFEEEFVSRLKTCSEGIRQDCQEANEVGIPATMVHTDIFWTNFYRQKESNASHGVMDFAEAIISHPFVDAAGGTGSVYLRDWTHYLAKHFPDIAQKASPQQCKNLLIITTKVSPVLTALRLFQEMEAVRFLVAPEMRNEFTGYLKSVLFNYEVSDDKRGSLWTQLVADGP